MASQSQPVVVPVINLPQAALPDARLETVPLEGTIIFHNIYDTFL